MHFFGDCRGNVDANQVSHRLRLGHFQKHDCIQHRVTTAQEMMIVKTVVFKSVLAHNWCVPTEAMAKAHGYCTLRVSPDMNSCTMYRLEVMLSGLWGSMHPTPLNSTMCLHSQQQAMRCVFTFPLAQSCTAHAEHTSNQALLYMSMSTCAS